MSTLSTSPIDINQLMQQFTSMMNQIVSIIITILPLMMLVSALRPPRTEERAK